MKKLLFVSAGALFIVSGVLAQDPALNVRNDTERSELVFTVGPLDLPTAEHGGVKQPRTQAVALPITGYLHSFTTEIVDRQGRELPSVLLHHVNIIAPERRELFSQIMQRVGAAGAETGPVKLPWFLGYPVERGDSLIFVVMLHNPTQTHYQGAQVRVRMKYSKVSSILPRLAIQPFHMDVMPPAGYHAYTLPPGRSSKSWEAKPAVAGRVLALGGHLHKYGVALRFEDVTARKVLWEVKPQTDANGDVVGVPQKFFLWSLGRRLDPSHTYRFTAEYDNPTGQAIEGGAMGTLGGVFLPTDGWPPVNRAHQEYVEDLRVTYARNNGDGGAHQHHH